jgi:quercetin dioxygenase-like cupin family protein
MKLLHPAEAARNAVAASAGRPATAILHDTPDLRLVVFRLAAGQSVPPHRSPSSVLLTVLAGTGMLSGEEASGPTEQQCTAGEQTAYLPSELHGMRALDTELLILATITPRPGSR